MSKQAHTPLFTCLKKHAMKNPLPFHIPGHKKGKEMAPEFRQFMGDQALSIDLINIQPLDDLHHPHGVIQEAQYLAAEAFGADSTPSSPCRGQRGHHGDGDVSSAVLEIRSLFPGMFINPFSPP